MSTAKQIHTCIKFKPTSMVSAEHALWRGRTRVGESVVRSHFLQPGRVALGQPREGRILFTLDLLFHPHLLNVHISQSF